MDKDSNLGDRCPFCKRSWRGMLEPVIRCPFCYCDPAKYDAAEQSIKCHCRREVADG